ncbi:copper amine oxidase N-terminal domain-containing protein [Acetoanaerobium noterae]|uniref:copper amine oxidase N-terminal domain-containing protein n=1 Tax=Acetoanaerobium noterae TaxID=745369 RepID=UPI00333FD1AD
MKKLLSLITVMAVVLTMIPFQSAFADDVSTKVKVENKLWVGNLDAQHGAVISLEESKTDSWGDGDKLVLKLPEGVTWHKYTRINGRPVRLSDIDGRSLTINLANTTQLNKVFVDPYFNVERSVEKGDIVVAVSGGRLSVDNGRITIAEVKDYGVKLSVADIVDFDYGQYKSKEVVVSLEEFVQGSILKDTEYELILENAKLDSSKDVLSRIKQGSRRLNVEQAESKVIKFTADDVNEKGKWDLVFSIIPDTDFEGNINIKLSGRGVDDTITIARVNKEFVALNSTPTNIALGHQDQAIASIEISETSAGAIMKGTHAILVNPEYKGMIFTSGKIQVSQGNIELDNFKYDNGILLFDVINPSTKASKIVINDLKVTIDEFGFVGNYTGQLTFNYNKNNEMKVDEFVLFNATTGKPVEQAAAFVGQFIIGSPNFTITTNGISRVEAFDVAPYIQDNRTMMSVKAAGVALDAKVSYDADKKMVTVESGDTKATMTIGSKILNINGEEKEMDTEAVISNNRTFIPLAFLADVFDAELKWDNVTKTVTIMKN